MKTIRQKSKIRIGILLLTFILTIILLCGCNLFRITKTNYDKIRNGMSFSEVVNILGDDYEVSSDAAVGGYQKFKFLV